MGYKAVVNFYSSYVLPYLFFLICLLLIALNIAALVYHLRRTKDASRYGTLFILLLTHIATAVLFLASFIPALILEINSNLFHVRWIFVLIVYLHDLLGRVRLMLTPVSSCFLALDRIFALTFPFKYAQNKVSKKFAAVAGVLNLFILFLHLLPILPFHYEPLLNLAEMLLETFALFHVPVGLMFMELLIYALFCIRYGSAVKKQANYTEKRSLINQIVLFQMVTHTLFFLFPSILRWLEDGFRVRSRVIMEIVTFQGEFNLLGLLVSSVFILHKLRPKKNVIQVLSTSKVPSNLRVMNKGPSPKVNIKLVTKIQ